MYYKENLFLRSVNVPFLSQCVFCEVPFKFKKVMSLLSINFQVNQQLNLTNAYPNLRINLIFLKDLNRPLLLYLFFIYFYFFIYFLFFIYIYYYYIFIFIIIFYTYYFIMGDFDARSKSWWPDDITLPEGIDMNLLITMHRLRQVILDPTHILPNLLSCIHLIFTDHPNLAVDCVVHPFVYPN